MEIILLVTFFGAWIAELRFNLIWHPGDGVLSTIHFILFFGSWGFLLLASSFFVRELRGLALAGRGIAVAVTLVMILAPFVMGR